MKNPLTLALTALLAATCMPRANAAIFTQPISLDIPFGQNPFFVDNAFLRQETFGPHVRYWQPTQTNVVGVVTYKFDVPFTIDSASLSLAITAYTAGSDANYDPGAETYLDISVDNVNWTTVASQTNQNAVFSGIEGPGDISSLVAGSNVVYARSRMLMTVAYAGFGTAQFLRQGEPYGGWEFTASSVPESSSIIAWVIIASGCFWRRSLKPRAK